MLRSPVPSNRMLPPSLAADAVNSLLAIRTSPADSISMSPPSAWLELTDTLDPWPSDTPLAKRNPTLPAAPSPVLALPIKPDSISNRSALNSIVPALPLPTVLVNSPLATVSPVSPPSMSFGSNSSPLPVIVTTPDFTAKAPATPPALAALSILAPFCNVMAPASTLIRLPAPEPVVLP